MIRELPSVSFVICNYDGRDYLQALFESLRALDYPRELIECIVVDNGSSDSSPEFIQQNLPEVKLIRNSQNLGFARACDQGAEAARGEWLAFVNNDMRLDPGWLRRLFAALGKCGDDVVCGGGKILSWDGRKVDFIGGTLTFYGHAFQREFGEDVPTVSADAPEEILFACGGSMLIRRDVFIEVGGFDEDYFAYFEDVDLGWRLWLMGYKVIFVPQAISYHHHFGTTKRFLESKHLFLCERNALFSVYKNYSDDNLNRILPVALVLIIARFFLYTGFDPGTVWREALYSPVGKEESEHRNENSFAKILHILGDMGVRGTIDRAALSLAIRELNKSGMYPVSEEGLSTLSAVPAFVSKLDKLAKKRKFVQAHRRRNDKEIFPLFKEQLRPFPDSSEYKYIFEKIVRDFGIHDIC